MVGGDRSVLFGRYSLAAAKLLAPSSYVFPAPSSCLLVCVQNRKPCMSISSSVKSQMGHKPPSSYALADHRHVHTYNAYRQGCSLSSEEDSASAGDLSASSTLPWTCARLSIRGSRERDGLEIFVLETKLKVRWTVVAGKGDGILQGLVDKLLNVPPERGGRRVKSGGHYPDDNTSSGTGEHCVQCSSTPTLFERAAGKSRREDCIATPRKEGIGRRSSRSPYPGQG